MSEVGAQPEAELILPPGFSMERSVDELKITYGWYTPRYWIYVILTVAAFYFLYPFWREGFIFFISCPLGWAGIGLLYYALTRFVNRTTIRAKATTLTVRHGPIPTFKNKQ
ncbi:MAG: hypothetical protein AAF485_08175, partial [Chloroflexota bacterium]